jgi:hypothetical protein
MINLDNLQNGIQTGDDISASELLKSMEAGLETGRDYSGETHNGQGLKVESLDPVVKVLANKMVQLRTWNIIPKKEVFNTVHEYNQLTKYGDEIGITNLEGESPSFTDSEYRRKAAVTKFMSVGGQVSHPAMLVNNAGGLDMLASEVQNKTMLLLTELNKGISTFDDSKIATQFPGLFRDHLTGIVEANGSTLGTAEANYDTYFNDVVVIDANGYALTDAMVEQATQAVVNDRNGLIVDTILTNPIVMSNYVKTFHESKRVMVGMANAVKGATMGQSVNNIQTQFGFVGVESDVYFDRKTIKRYNTAATHAQSPAKPTKDGSTPIAVNADTKTKFVAGTYYYAVTAKNRYGESAMEVINTSGQAVTALQSVDIKFAAGTGNYAAECFVIYRTEASPASYTTANYYPLFQVTAAELATGYDGAAATLVRDRDRLKANTHSAFVMSNSSEMWEYLQLAPTMRMDFAITTLSRRFAVVNYGTSVLYQPGKVARIINIGTRLPA